MQEIDQEIREVKQIENERVSYMTLAMKMMEDIRAHVKDYRDEEEVDIAALLRPIAIQREKHVEVSAYVYVPVERENAEGVSVVHPPERQKAFEVIVPPKCGEETEAGIVLLPMWKCWQFQCC